MVIELIKAGWTAARGMEPIELRAPDPAQAELGLAILTDPELMKDFMLGWDKEVTPERYQALIRRVEADAHRYSWWIYVGGQFAGIIGLWDHTAGTKRTFESYKLFYVVSRQFQRRRVATNAVKAVLNFCFGTLGVEGVAVEVLERNVAGIAFAKTIGFSHQSSNDDWEEGGDRHGVWYGFFHRQNWESDPE